MFLGVGFFIVFAAVMLLAYVGSGSGVVGLMRGVPGAEKVDIMVGGKRVRCRVVRDRWWYDTIEVQAVATYDFFQTTTGKTRAYQHFEGDRSLVKEREYALIYAAVAYMLDQTHLLLPPIVDTLPLFDDASFRWEQDDVVVDEDRLKVLAGGVSHRVSGLLAAAGESQPGDGRHDNMRVYTKPKLITGGRSVDFSVTTGTILAAKHDLQIALYGLHLIPTAVIRKLTAAQAAAERARRRAMRAARR